MFDDFTANQEDDILGLQCHLKKIYINEFFNQIFTHYK